MWSQHHSDSHDSGLPNDIYCALTRLTQFIRDGHADVEPYFDPHQSLVAARAPGRLDVMGGIADYSGSTVLQLPLTESAVVFCQFTDEPVVRVISALANSLHEHRSVCLPVADFFDEKTGSPLSPTLMRRHFQSLPEDQQWVAYIAGVIPVLMNATEFVLDQGVVIYLYSTVPEGKGVSSSAAIEVATMRALTRAKALTLDAHQQAILSQQVENHVVGAPCGLMDQMTSSVGRKNSLLSLLCQPDIVQEPVYLPAGLAVWGIDSGLRHQVSGSDYASVRIAAFMGYRLLLEAAGIADNSVKAIDIVDARWNGYLANVSVSEFNQHYQTMLPQSMTGAEFLTRFDATTDTVTEVLSDASYAVRCCTSHPVNEHFRARQFSHLASTTAVGEKLATSAQLMGECMYQSHAGYSMCDIGSTGTDDLVARLRKAGPESGIYGARITGGGSGGTVAVLARVEADDLIKSIASAYAIEAGLGGHVFSGSSDGASDLILHPAER